MLQLVRTLDCLHNAITSAWHRNLHSVDRKARPSYINFALPSRTESPVFFTVIPSEVAERLSKSAPGAGFLPSSFGAGVASLLL